MSQIVLICPHCNMRLGANAPPAAGTVLTCPTCSKQFAAPPASIPPSQPAPPRKAPPKAAKPPKVQPAAPVASQPEFAPLTQPTYVPPPSHPQYYAPPGYAQGYGSATPANSSQGLIIGLSVAAGVIALLLVIGVIVLFSLPSGIPVAEAPVAPAGNAANSQTTALPVDKSAAQAVPQAVPAFAVPISQPSPASAVPLAAGAGNTPFSSAATASSSNAVRQLPIIGVDAALAYRWEPGKNYDYDFQLNASMDNRPISFTGNTSYKLNPWSSGRAARVAGGEGEKQASGTAFVVHSDGLLVTCAHVVRGSSKVSVTIGDRPYPGDVVGVDDRHDLALIRVAASNLPTVPLANSDQVQLAEEVRAVGFPLSNVLGTSVKITGGSIAGVVTKDGDRLLQIDASINPGNSGGPLFNDRGEVVGINSAGLVGEAITNVGFAVPSNYALALLQSKGISPSATSKGKQLTGPELARQVTPAVAFVKVDLGSAESMQFLEYSGLCMKSSATLEIGRPGSSPVSDKGDLVISPTGEILQSSTEAQLPLLFTPLSSLAIEKLPSGVDREWESRRVIALMLPNPEPESASPFEPGFGRSGRYSRSRLRPPPQERGALIIPAVEQIKYKILSETTEAIEIEKTTDISCVSPDGGAAVFQITGRGNITWDKKWGAPRLIKQAMTLAISVGPTRASVPMDLTVALGGVTTDAERAASPRARANSPSIAGSASSSPTVPSTSPTPPKRTEKTLDELLAPLRSKGQPKPEMVTPLNELCSMEPVPSRREEVAALLDPLLEVKNESIRGAAIRAVKKWGTQKNVPTLLKILEWKTKGDRWAAMEALGDIGGSKQAAAAVAKLLLDQEDQHNAVSSLKQMGAVAEDAVWPYIESSDTLLHSYVCSILGSIGTQKSAARIQSVLKNKKVRDGLLESALRDIQKRLANK